MWPLIKRQPQTFGSSWILNIFNPPQPTKIVITVDTSEIILIVGYNEILQASEEARGEDFSNSNKDISLKFRSNL
jgi:hypothetical protein